MLQIIARISVVYKQLFLTFSVIISYISIFGIVFDENLLDKAP